MTTENHMTSEHPILLQHKLFGIIQNIDHVMAPRTHRTCIHKRSCHIALGVVVIWANTQLAHKVSMPFATAAPEKTITVARRSVSALATEVSRHVLSKGARRRP